MSKKRYFRHSETLLAQAIWALVTGTFTREEALRNVRATPPEVEDRLRAILRDLEVVEHPPDLECPAGLVDKDRPVFQAALGRGASHLLTGDLKHFGQFMSRPEDTSGVHVQTVAAFLESLSG